MDDSSIDDEWHAVNDKIMDKDKPINNTFFILHSKLVIIIILQIIAVVCMDFSKTYNETFKKSVQMEINYTRFTKPKSEKWNSMY